MSEGLGKRLVLAGLVVVGLSLSVGLGAWTRRHWEWLEANHLAGLAVLEVLFVAVSALGAVTLVRRDWKGQTAAEVARSYSLAFGAMLVVFLGTGVLIFLAAWVWAFLNAALRLSFERRPWLMLGGLFGVFLVMYWWGRGRPRSPLSRLMLRLGAKRRRRRARDGEEAESEI